MLDLIPCNSKVIIHKLKELDEWGQSDAGDSITVACSMRDMTSLEYDTLTKGNKEIKLSSVIRIAGDICVSLADTLEVDSCIYQIVKIKRVRDLTGDTISTLLYV